MKAIVLEGLISVLFFAAGVFFVGSNAIHFSNSAYATPLISGAVLLFVGLILLVLTIKSLITYLNTHKAEEPAVETVVVKSNNLLERNNEMANDWNKTNDARDKLKMLQMQARAGDAEE